LFMKFSVFAETNIHFVFNKETLKGPFLIQLNTFLNFTPYLCVNLCLYHVRIQSVIFLHLGVKESVSRIQFVEFCILLKITLNSTGKFYIVSYWKSDVGEVKPDVLQKHF
jgi:hypothetical protein